MVLLLRCGAGGPAGEGQAGKVKVITTLFPLYDFAKNVGGEKAEVMLLLPPGVEAHSFEPKPSDILKINNADIFVYTGKFMEPWANDVINSVEGAGLTAVDASAGIILEKESVHDDHEEHEGMDPHIWMDFDDAKIMIENVLNGFTAADPANKIYYERNAVALQAKLSKLDDDFRAALQGCRTRKIVYGGHYAFGYLAKRYGLQYMAAQGFSPDAEPTANDMVNLVRQIKDNNIRYIFYEELSNPEIAKMLASETGAEMLLLNAAHNLTKDEFEGGVTFISIMEKNLLNLKTGLECGN